MFKELITFGNLSSLLLASRSKFLFQNERLQKAVTLYEEANELSSQNKLEDACYVYMQGIFTGRNAVRDLVENQDSKNDMDDPQLALEWIVASYLSRSRNHIELGDWNMARSDAWAACSYSQNQNLEALKCMLTVCQQTEDLFNELQTLKLILQLLVSLGDDDEDQGDFSRNRINVETVEKQIMDVESKLEEKFNNR